MNSLQDQKIVIAGGSGFLGTSLAHHLTDNGAQVVVLSRAKSGSYESWQHCQWDGRTIGPWAEVLRGAHGIVNLCGRSVDCIKTPTHQDEILRSRVESTRVLGNVMRELDTPPRVWVQMSTAHIYGDPPTAVCDEDSAFGLGFAPMVGQAWEQAFHEGVLPSQRGVVLRTSFVIGRNRGAGGGALSKLTGLAKCGLGGRVGRGTQGMSWIHEADMNQLFERALTNESMRGVYVASSPNPSSQVDFMRAVRKAIGMPIGLPAFEWMVRLGAPVIMRTDPELALYGRFVVPSRLLDEGHRFQWPHLDAALQDLMA